MKLLPSALACLALATGAFAETPTDTAPQALSPAPSAAIGAAWRLALNGLAATAIAEPAVAAYLGTGNDVNKIDESRIICRVDLNADGIDDNIVGLRSGQSVVLAAYLNSADGAMAAPVFAGAVRLDSAELPVVQSEDITGDGAPELRLVFSRPGLPGSEIKTLSIAGMVDGKFAELFRTVLDQVERSGVDHRRCTQIVRLIDGEEGEARQIQVDTRIVELVGADGEEREIATSVISGTTVYSLVNGRYVVQTSELRLPTAEQMLSAAAELMDAGALDRAMVLAEGLKIAEGTTGNLTISRRANALTNKIRAAAVAEAEVSANKPALPQ